MVIGIDIEKQTNVEEGYMLMEFKVKELRPKGVFNPDMPCNFFAYYPSYLIEETDNNGTFNHPNGKFLRMTDVDLTANDLWNMYLDHKDSIDSMIGDTHEFPTNEHNMLTIASDVSSHCGL